MHISIYVFVPIQVTAVTLTLDRSRHANDSSIIIVIIIIIIIIVTIIIIIITSSRSSSSLLLSSSIIIIIVTIIIIIKIMFLVTAVTLMLDRSRHANDSSSGNSSYNDCTTSPGIGRFVFASLTFLYSLLSLIFFCTDAFLAGLYGSI
jgi:small-conductance mechanosensitive channel